jgi:hypothetical protein
MNGRTPWPRLAAAMPSPALFPAEHASGACGRTGAERGPSEADDGSRTRDLRLGKPKWGCLAPVVTGNSAARDALEIGVSGQEGCPRPLPGGAVARTVARTDVASEATCKLHVDGTKSERKTLHPRARDRPILYGKWSRNGQPAAAPLFSVAFEHSASCSRASASMRVAASASVRTPSGARPRLRRHPRSRHTQSERGPTRGLTK